MTERKLYNVTVKTDLMVMATSSKEAETIAKKKAVNEVEYYGKCSSRMIRDIGELSKEWKDNVPYAAELNPEFRKCSEIIEEDIKSVGDEDLEDIVEIQKKSKSSKLPVENIKEEEEIMPETRPDPKPRDLKWCETKSGNPLPSLRFNIPGRK